MAFCAGNSPVTGEFPAPRPVTRNFDVFFDLCLNKQVSKQSWGWWSVTPSSSLWRPCNGNAILPLQMGMKRFNSVSTENKFLLHLDSCRRWVPFGEWSCTLWSAVYFELFSQTRHYNDAFDYILEVVACIHSIKQGEMNLVGFENEAKSLKKHSQIIFRMFIIKFLFYSRHKTENWTCVVHWYSLLWSLVIKNICIYVWSQTR